MAVIFDRVPLCVNFPREIAMPFEPFADAEERRASAALAQDRQDMRGHLRVRAIVDRDRDARRVPLLRPAVA